MRTFIFYLYHTCKFLFPHKKYVCAVNLHSEYVIVAADADKDLTILRSLTFSLCSMSQIITPFHLHTHAQDCKYYDFISLNMATKMSSYVILNKTIHLSFFFYYIPFIVYDIRGNILTVSQIGYINSLFFTYVTILFFHSLC